MEHVRKTIVICALVSALLIPLFAAEVPYLHVQAPLEASFYQFNEKGVLIHPEPVPAQLKEGWIVLSDQQPLTISNSLLTIVLQPESMLGIGSTAGNDFAFYLMAGSGSFLVKPPFSGTFSVSTAAGRYKLSDPGEMFITSDVSEMVFSLQSTVQATNAITRRISTIPEHSYLNMADPFATIKSISLQTYTALSINQRTEETTELISYEADEQTPFTDAPEPLASVEQLIADSPAVIPAKPEVPEIVVEKPQFDFYIVHTSDILGNIDEQGIGISRFATLLDWGRGITDRALLLDAGNTISGTSLVDTFNGVPAATLLQMLGYDAAAPGPADYRYGYDVLAQFAKTTDTPAILGANVLDQGGNHLFTPYRLYDLDGFTIGVIGISIPPASETELTFYNETIVNQAQALVDEVAELSDFVVLLGNIGSRTELSSSDIAASVTGIDLIIDGSASPLPESGKQVGDTLIVGTDSNLESVGIVEVHVIGDTAASMHALRITASDVLEPTQSALASAFGIEQVPQDSAVLSYVAGVKNAYAELQKAIEPPPIHLVAEQKTEEEPTFVEPPTQVKPADGDALTIKAPVGIISSVEEPKAKEPPLWGLTSRFSFTRDGLSGIQQPRVGLSIHPFVKTNGFDLGLQAFFLTKDSLFSYQDWEYSNLEWDSEGDTAEMIRMATRFIDYVRIGHPDDNFYLNADQSTPINWGNRVLVNSLGVASGPYHQHLGLTAKAAIGAVGLELFLDDLYLTNWVEGNKQHAGARLIFAPNSPFSLALGALFASGRNSDYIAYPTLDLNWKLKDERKLGIELFGTLATALNLNDIDADDIFDAQGNTVEQMFPNFLFAGGLDFRTLKWNFRLAAAAQNRTNDFDLLSFGSLNSTKYSGTSMLDNSDLFYTLYAEARTNGKRLNFGSSYQVPLKKDFSGLVTLDSSTVEGDIFAIEGSYSGSHLSASLGYRRVGFLSGAMELLDVTGGMNTVAEHLKDFLLGGSSAERKQIQPYASVSYTTGALALTGELSLADQIRFSLISSVTLGAKAADETSTTGGTLLASGAKKDATWKTSMNLGGSYVRAFATDGSSDENYLTVRPVFQIAKANSFSLGLGPRLALNANTTKLYSDLGDEFSFGRDENASDARIYDLATDVLGFVDHLVIGNSDSLFNLEISRSERQFKGALVSQLGVGESTLQSPLAFTSSVNTKHVSFDLFINDLLRAQLGGISLAVKPLQNYEMAVVFESLISASILTDTAKRFDFIPTFGLNLPVGDTVELHGFVSTFMGYDSALGFKQFGILRDGGIFSIAVDNYVASVGVALKAGSLGIDVDAAVQKGVLSYGMFNSFFKRQRADVLTTFAKPWDTLASEELSYTASAAIGWESEKLNLKASYLLPLSDSLVANTAGDLLSLSSELKLKWVNLSLTYAKQGFIDGIQQVISTTSDVVDEARDFLFASDSIFSLAAAVTQGAVTFNAELSSLARYEKDTGWNNQKLLSVTPALSLGVDIRLF